MKKLSLMVLGFAMTVFGASVYADLGPGDHDRGGNGGGRGNPGQQQALACFYADDNYQGASFCKSIGQDDDNLVNDNFNDKISSIALFGDISVTVYEDSLYRGDALQINGDISNFKGTKWNDRISSITLRWGRNQPPPRQDGQVCLYKDSNFVGSSFCYAVDSDVGNLKDVGFNDKASSIRIYGNAVVTVYEDSEYRGQSLFVSADVLNFGGTFWNDRISSLSVRRRW